MENVRRMHTTTRHGHLEKEREHRYWKATSKFWPQVEGQGKI